MIDLIDVHRELYTYPSVLGIRNDVIHLGSANEDKKEVMRAVLKWVTIFTRTWDETHRASVTFERGVSYYVPATQRVNINPDPLVKVLYKDWYMGGSRYTNSSDQVLGAMAVLAGFGSHEIWHKLVGDRGFWANCRDDSRSLTNIISDENLENRAMEGRRLVHGIFSKTHQEFFAEGYGKFIDAFNAGTLTASSLIFHGLRYDPRSLRFELARYQGANKTELVDLADAINHWNARFPVQNPDTELTQCFNDLFKFIKRDEQEPVDFDDTDDWDEEEEDEDDGRQVDDEDLDGDLENNADDDEDNRDPMENEGEDDEDADDDEEVDPEKEANDVLDDAAAKGSDEAEEGYDPSDDEGEEGESDDEGEGDAKSPSTAIPQDDNDPFNQDGEHSGGNEDTYDNPSLDPADLPDEIDKDLDELGDQEPEKDEGLRTLPVPPMSNTIQKASQIVVDEIKSPTESAIDRKWGERGTPSRNVMDANYDFIRQQANALFNKLSSSSLFIDGLHTATGQRTGSSLDGGNLTDIWENGNVFKKMTQDERTPVRMNLIIDFSGSMHYHDGYVMSRNQLAPLDMCKVFTMAISRYCEAFGYPFEIFGFTGRQVQHFKNADAMMQFHKSGGTNDGQGMLGAIKWALNEAPDAKQAFILLADGGGDTELVRSTAYSIIKEGYHFGQIMVDLYGDRYRIATGDRICDVSVKNDISDSANAVNKMILGLLEETEARNVNRI